MDKFKVQLMTLVFLGLTLLSWLHYQIAYGDRLVVPASTPYSNLVISKMKTFTYLLKQNPEISSNLAGIGLTRAKGPFLMRIEFTDWLRPRDGLV
jgi:hypothetical protein